MSWFSALSVGFLHVTPPELVLVLVLLGLVSLVWALVLHRTLRRRTEELLATAAKFQALVNRLPVGVFRATTEGKILACNPATAELFGYPSVEALAEVGAASLYAPRSGRPFLAPSGVHVICRCTRSCFGARTVNPFGYCGMLPWRWRVDRRSLRVWS
ncbi:MAG: PAS domain-containing protein [Thermoanaerobaculum sp.]|nr:PAS domain-containing protein [Thermoanaerobaculum sp.]MDW7967351.1 PAS domain-containing protein [Thermoanaerobaculum sp.]